MKSTEFVRYHLDFARILKTHVKLSPVKHCPAPCVRLRPGLNGSMMLWCLSGLTLVRPLDCWVRWAAGRGQARWNAARNIGTLGSNNLQFSVPVATTNRQPWTIGFWCPLTSTRWDSEYSAHLRCQSKTYIMWKAHHKLKHRLTAENSRWNTELHDCWNYINCNVLLIDDVNMFVSNWYKNWTLRPPRWWL